MTLIAPSILSADFTCLGQEIRAAEQAGADWIHLDVMDGHFVPNITMGPLVVQAVRRCTTLPVDVHLMISNPDAYITDFANAGADYISVQVEACIHLHRSIQLIKSQGKKAGAVLNPATPLSSIQWVLQDLDFVLIMSVNPGFGGQKFIHSALDKIRQVKDMIRSKGLNTLIQVDGGVNADTVGAVTESGADVCVAGSAVFNTDDYAEAIRTLKTNSRGN
ncbi:MAG: ribulose-phosphate 3-epimerase [Desulfobacteraceae bacterium]|nr:ribulose-phosphate 3-epimerase [Desulfobacteraceae bacterium]